MMHQNDDLRHILYESPNSIDQLLSKELLKLSPIDRNAVNEEIHGVSTLALKESPHFLETSLQELCKELNEIPDDSQIKAAYAESQVLPKTYVNTSDFRLRFLRCELFDANKAAWRMVKFLDLALHLFGPIALQRPIRITDFTKEEKKLLQAGDCQILPYRDQSGRQIIATVGNIAFRKSDSKSGWRIRFYLGYCKSDDVETQQKGYVSLIWNVNDQLRMPIKWEDFEYSKRLHEASPVRVCSMHWCLPPGLPLTHPTHVVRAAYALSLGKGQSRIKFHIGEPVELLYKLKTYGIPIESIPITDTGNVKTNHLRQWMRGRNYMEQMMGQESSWMTLCPSSVDVLFRGGTSLKNHPGNVMLESIIEGKIGDHVSATSNEKAAIIKSIINTIQKEGRRFLMWDKHGLWKEMEDVSQIHAKVAEKCRSLRSRMVAQQQTAKSSTLAFQNQDNSKRRKIMRDDNFDGSSFVGGCCNMCI